MSDVIKLPWDPAEIARRIVNGDLSAAEAVHAYHGVLQGLKIKPHRSLHDDLKLTEPVFSYDRGRTAVTVPGTTSRPVVGTAARRPQRPDFGKMSGQERTEYHRKRLRGVGGA